MPLNTANYNLTLYDRTADKNQQFINFREDIAGTIISSNMNKIDNQMKINADAISDLAGVGRTTETTKQNTDNIEQLKEGFIHEVIATGTDTYTGTSTTINSYYSGQKILLKAANDNTSNSTLNINGLGAKSLRKIENGSEIELSSGNIKQNQLQFFEFNGSSWIAIGNLGTGDMQACMYDPSNIKANIFDMDNMVESATAKIMTDAERTKLNNIADNANNYLHPINHPPSIITQDSTHRFVTDAEKTTWNGKQDSLGFTPANISHNHTLLEVTDFDPSSKLDTTAQAADSDKIDGNHIWTGTQAEYDAIGTPDENTLYFIIG